MNSAPTRLNNSSRNKLHSLCKGSRSTFSSKNWTKIGRSSSKTCKICLPKSNTLSPNKNCLRFASKSSNCEKLISSSPNTFSRCTTSITAPPLSHPTSKWNTMTPCWTISTRTTSLWKTRFWTNIWGSTKAMTLSWWTSIKRFIGVRAYPSTQPSKNFSTWISAMPIDWWRQKTWYCS